MKKILAIENNEFNIQLTLLNKCNFKCSYCPPRLNNGSTPSIPTDDYINFFKNLFLDNPEILKYEKKFVGLTGGEPTIYEGIDSIIDFFKDHGFNIALDTNGSAKMNFWERNLSKINITNLSVHLKYFNLQHVLNIVQLGVEKQSVVKVGIVMDPKYWERGLEAISFFKEHNVPIMEFKGLVFKLPKSELKDDQKSQYYYETYSEEQTKWLKNNTYHTNINLKDVNPNYQTRNANILYEDGTKEKFLGQKVISNNLNKFKGYQCEAGKSNLSIKWNGIVEGSHCKIGNNYFGNLIENKDLRIKLRKEPIICPYEKCGCISDMRIKKWVNN
jgi:MoaA/NifB/PqqE/SkfB family radical SAM enzyme